MLTSLIPIFDSKEVQMLFTMLKLCLVVLLSVVRSNNCDVKTVNGITVGQLVSNKVTNSAEFPYVVRIRSVVEVYRNNEQTLEELSCGGSIIKPNVILTAAHCVIFNKPENITIYAGALQKELKYLEPGMQVAKVSRISIHEEFNYVSMGYDIALLFLKTPFQITKYVKTINLPFATDYNLGVPAVVVGWGVDQDNKQPELLQKISLVQFPSSLCQLYTNYTIIKSMFCAIDPKHVQAVCKGDSGGPIVFNNRVIGIASWGVKRLKVTSCNAHVPSVFSKVLSFRDWIMGKIMEESVF